MSAREYTAEDLAELAGRNCATDALELMLETEDTGERVRILRNSLLELHTLPHPECASMGFAKNIYGTMSPDMDVGLTPYIRAVAEQAGVEVAEKCLAILSREGVDFSEAITEFKNGLTDLATDCVHPWAASIGFSKKFAPMFVLLMEQYRLHERESAK